MRFDELQTGVKTAAAFVEDSEEIQMEVEEARRKREEVEAREIEKIVGEESLECNLETFEGKNEAERKRREIREEEEEKLEWEREKQMREQLMETEGVKKQGQAAHEKKRQERSGYVRDRKTRLGSTGGSKTNGVGRAERKNRGLMKGG